MEIYGRCRGIKVNFSPCVMTWAVLAKFAKFVLGTPKGVPYIKSICLYCSRKRIIITCGGIDMDYMTLKEAGEKWGVTPRWINYYCSAGRIPGAVKMERFG